MAEHEARDTVGYVLKGYPRISELFIASEIWRLEQLGLPLRLFVLKPADEAEHHPVVDRIEATPSYLPETTSLSGVGIRQWLRENLGLLPAGTRAGGAPAPAADAAGGGRRGRAVGPGPGRAAATRDLPQGVPAGSGRRGPAVARPRTYGTCTRTSPTARPR